MNIKNKVAIVTGGNSGIGAAIVEKLNDYGAKVVVAGKDEKKLENFIFNFRNNIKGKRCDVRNITEIKDLVNYTVSTFGKIDYIFACAGISRVMSINEISESVFDDISNTNFKGAYFTAKEAIPYMNDEGSILFISSITAHLGIPGNSVYGATKAALRSAARIISSDLRSRKIRANVITPDPVNTPLFSEPTKSSERVITTTQEISNLTPYRRLATSEEIATAAIFLCSDICSYVVGEELIIDGGWKNIYEWR